jgi:hypothetical protein
MDADRRHAPATLRNREPILAVLTRIFHTPGSVLEVASGSGEHAVWFAGKLPHRIWQPSDPDAGARASIASWQREAKQSNLLPPVDLDASAAAWPVVASDAVVCINMIHIAPIEACDGLFAGAARILAPGAPLYMYGPYKRNGAHTAESNARFDEGLRAQNPAWGVRDLEDVIARAARHGLRHEETIAMPANNQSLVFRR